jgi:hypothetical protein
VERVAPLTGSSLAAAAACVPARPARAEGIVQIITDRTKAPRLSNRQALLHNLVHIENW